MRQKIYGERLHETLKMGPLRATWDLNALHQLVELGKAYWLTSEERYASQYLLQSLDWMEKNPPNMGINWVDEMAVARRAIAWVFALELFLSSPSLSGDFVLRAVKMALMHGAYLADYLHHSRDEDRSGYRLAATAALHLVACAYPEFRTSARWREIAETLFAAVLEDELGADGAHRSGSLDMHRLCCEFAVLPHLLARYGGHKLSAPSRNLTVQALGFMLEMQGPGWFLSAYRILLAGAGPAFWTAVSDGRAGFDVSGGRVVLARRPETFQSTFLASGLAGRRGFCRASAPQSAEDAGDGRRAALCGGVAGRLPRRLG